MARISYICGACGSKHVEFDADAAWSIELQQFELTSKYDNMFCRDCYRDTDEHEIVDLDGTTNVVEPAPWTDDEQSIAVKQRWGIAIVEHRRKIVAIPNDGSSRAIGVLQTVRNMAEREDVLAIHAMAIHKFDNGRSLYLITAIDEIDDETSNPMFWSNADGWTSRDQADRFNAEEHNRLSLPIGGQWMLDEAIG